MVFIMEYGLFLAKTVTLVFAIALIIGLIANAAGKSKSKKGQLHCTDLTKHYQQQQQAVQEQLLDKKSFKQWLKQHKTPENKASRVFVLEFHGGIQAKETEALREEVTAILGVATAQDEVLLKLESGGGVVHGYGLAASQLTRLKQAGIPLTVAVDKVAASGGYMMACVAEKILAAPFAIIGSIGVIAQLPNFNKVLKQHNVDFEQFTAGEFKRTVTLFGENTDKGRQKFQQELEDTHQLFKQFVSHQRPQLDIEQVATGEHWFGYQALDLKLIDKLQTSDDYLLSALERAHIVAFSFKQPKGLAEKIGQGSAELCSAVWQKLSDSSRWF
ncbi:protease SohB [Arsukibacterium sp.]|uniref:protease SohB n=1 Tax=Arsukibacterium sp. TaxID=1977258 RepID=UPI002FDA0AB2